MSDNIHSCHSFRRGTEEPGEPTAEDSPVVLYHRIGPDTDSCDAATDIWSLFKTVFTRFDSPDIVLTVAIDGHRVPPSKLSSLYESPLEPELDQFISRFLIPVAGGLCDELHIDGPRDRHLDCADATLGDTITPPNGTPDHRSPPIIADHDNSQQLLTQGQLLVKCHSKTFNYVIIDADVYSRLIGHKDITEDVLIEMFITQAP